MPGSPQPGQEPYQNYPKTGTVGSSPPSMGAVALIPLEIGMMGFSLEDTLHGDKGYVLWMDTDKLNTKILRNNSWSDIIPLISDEGPFDVNSYFDISKGLQQSRLCITWINKTSSPFDVRLHH